MRFDLPLLPVPSAEWQAEWDALMQSEWLRKKLDRTRRMREHQQYVEAWMADELRQPRGLVIDVGPGAGELLEFTRAAGHDILGIDAPNGIGGMGDDYQRATMLMHQRQRIPVEYDSFLSWLAHSSAAREGKCVVCNFRGSIEQVAARYMEGPPHHTDHCAATKAWTETAETESMVAALFQHLSRLLRQDGVVTMHCNGAMNHGWFAARADESAKAARLKMVGGDGDRMFKWRKR